MSSPWPGHLAPSSQSLFPLQATGDANLQQMSLPSSTQRFPFGRKLVRMSNANLQTTDFAGGDPSGLESSQ